MSFHKRTNYRNFSRYIKSKCPKITQVVNEGQLSIIKPNVAHTMVFTKDTTFLNLVRGERDHETTEFHTQLDTGL